MKCYIDNSVIICDEIIDVNYLCDEVLSINLNDKKATCKMIILKFIIIINECMYEYIKIYTIYLCMIT